MVLDNNNPRTFCVLENTTDKHFIRSFKTNVLGLRGKVLVVGGLHWRLLCLINRIYFHRKIYAVLSNYVTYRGLCFQSCL